MHRLVKVLFIVISIAFLTTSIYLYISKETEHNLRIQLEKRLTDIEAEKDRLTEELRGAQNTREELQAKIMEIQKASETHESTIAELKETKDSLAAQLEEREAAVANLNNELDDLKSERQNLATQLTKSQKDINAIKEQLSIVRKEKQALEEKFKQLATQKEIELKKIVVKPAPSMKEGQVVIVNREYDFVIINLGQRDGLKIGTILEIYRGENLIGKVQVEKLYEALCSANILPEYKKQPIQEGDIARASSS